MTDRDDPIRRRRNTGPKPRESIEELYGDVLAPKPIGLFDPDPGTETPRHRDAAFSELAHGGGGGRPPLRTYHATAEGAPGSFKRGGHLEFPRKGGDLTPIVLSHGLVTLLTLGIWRFWQVTAQRRSIWAHTKLAGEPFEYRGTGLELFIGGAAAAVVVAAAMLIFQLALGAFGLSTWLGLKVSMDLLGVPLSLASVLVVLPLIELARFRARRYRLRRTRWRGIRFDMRGSGLGIMALWAAWVPVVIATLGLAVPFLSTARERWMMNRAEWGSEPFFFRGSAWRLMPSWGFIWLLLAAPMVIGGAHVWNAVDRAAGLPSYSPPPPPARIRPEGSVPEIAPITPQIAPASLGEPPGLGEVVPATPKTAPAPLMSAPLLPDTEAAPLEPATKTPRSTMPPAPDPAAPATPDPAAVPTPDPSDAPLSYTPVQRLDVEPPDPPEAATLRTLVRDVATTLIPLRNHIVGATGSVATLNPSMQLLLTLGWGVMLIYGWLDYRAARIRVFMNARRIAGAQAKCTFGPGGLFDAWLAVLGRSIWPGLLVYALIVIVVMILLFNMSPGADRASGPWDLAFGGIADARTKGLAIMVLAMNYGLSALFGMWLMEVVWFRAFFHKLCASTQMTGLETLDHVRQRPAAQAAEADGLEDAFDLDAGF